MANGLHQSGLEYLHGNFISTIMKTGEKIDDDIQYECAWRLGNWNVCEANRTVHTQNDYNFEAEISEQDYHFYHYQALKYFHEGNATGIQKAIRNARISIIQALRNLSLGKWHPLFQYSKYFIYLYVCSFQKVVRLCTKN